MTFEAKAGVAIETSPLCSERKVAICPVKKRSDPAAAIPKPVGSQALPGQNSKGTKNRPITMLLQKRITHVVTPRPSAIFKQMAAVA
jgi:hypothetical protein